MITIIHILVVSSTLILVLFADHYGYTWISGKTSLLDKNKLNKLHNYTWVGIILILITGGTIFYYDYKTLLSSYVFLLKMAFVTTLIVNSFSIGILKNIATKHKFSDLSIKDKLPLIITGGTSTICWLGALTCAFFIY